MLSTPEKCPLIKTCKEKVPKDIFEDICMTPGWIYCESAVEEAKKHFKLPREWMKEYEEEME